MDFCRTRHFEQADLELAENTPEEILAGAAEMLGRLEGTYRESPEQARCYRQIKEIEERADRQRRQRQEPRPATFVPLYALYRSPARISSEFLQLNPFFAGHPWPTQVRFDWDPEFSYCA